MMNSHLKKKNSYNGSNRKLKQDNKDNIKAKDKKLMNKFILNNQELINNFRKKNSKTPNKVRKQSPSFLINNKKIDSAKLSRTKKNNLNEIDSYNMIKKSNLLSAKNNKNRKNKSNNNSQQKNKNNNISNSNVLSRSESFSILKTRSILPIKNLLDKNTTNEINNLNNISNKENLINQNSNNNDNIPLKKKKIVKKIYKIESICQVGYSGPGILKYNQDNFFVYNNLNDENDVLFVGVCDGHGILGHDVSKYLISHLPSNLNKALKKTRKYIRDKKTLYPTMKEVFIKTNEDLCKNDDIDTQFSGSTCVTIILTKNKIISGNVGDSRAVMGRCENGVWKNIDLTKDQKPDNPKEKERILKRGGRIESYKDENGNDFGPKRVWLKEADIPGLAMARSFGDEVAASVGTISEPEIECFDITEDDKFIIIASDGIWEFISSLECVNIVKDYYLKKDLKGCLKYLLNESSKRWIKEEEVIDDITAVLIFFEN